MPAQIWPGIWEASPTAKMAGWLRALVRSAQDPHNAWLTHLRTHRGGNDFCFKNQQFSTACICELYHVDCKGTVQIGLKNNH